MGNKSISRIFLSFESPSVVGTNICLADWQATGEMLVWSPLLAFLGGRWIRVC